MQSPEIFLRGFWKSHEKLMIRELPESLEKFSSDFRDFGKIFESPQRFPRGSSVT